MNKIGTSLSSLFGSDYLNHIHVGENYWYWFSLESDIYMKYKINWMRIHITFIRSGAVFYTFPDHSEIEERYFDASSFMAYTIEPEILYLHKEGLSNVSPLQFDQTHTKVYK